MTRAEVDQLVDWAAIEGWNPGLNDAELFWSTDPDACIAAELQGKLIGGGAITSYLGQYGFMGFFIVRPEFRGKGYGNTLWQARRQRMLDRLNPGATIGMDGVFDMQDYYAKGGFVYSHRNLRFLHRGPTQAQKASQVVLISEVDFTEVVAYDRTCFPADRSDFLKGWISQPGSLALAYREGDRLRGFGAIRPCREGCKVGPLFADNGEVAKALFSNLAGSAKEGPVFLDVPENNSAAMALVADYNMAEVFGCARMYLGDPPELEHERIFGVTTFELG